MPVGKAGLETLAVLEQRLAVLEGRLERNTAVLDEIHLAVVGDGSNPLIARIAVSESEIATMKGWRTKAIAGVAQSLLSVLVAVLAAALGIHIPARPS